MENLLQHEIPRYGTEDRVASEKIIALGFGDMSHHKPSILLRFDLHTNVDTVSTIENWHPTGHENHNTWFSYIRYSGWKKSFITLDGWNPINNGINHLSTGAGLIPSTIFQLLKDFSKATPPDWRFPSHFRFRNIDPMEVLKSGYKALLGNEQMASSPSKMMI